jgi:phosphoribosylglycinamide formyltransferase-1
LVCNRADAGVLKVAERYALPVKLFSNEEIEEGTKLLEFLKLEKVEWIVLAGFLRKIPMNLIQAYPQRIINLHPSLLPKYGGKGMYGSRVHKAVLNNKEPKSGISIHLVNEEFDQGKLIAQFSCKLETEDDLETLEQKIQELEHHHFPRVIEEHINQQITR